MTEDDGFSPQGTATTDRDYWESGEFLNVENAELDKWRAARGHATRPYRTGLALSGGGIRSAVFSLGVLQALARHGILGHVDYLSTVSGGGYIGSALNWWWGRAHGRQPTPPATGFGVTAADFPYGTADPALAAPAGPSSGNDADQQAVLQHLRHNGNYLIPGAGITLASGIAIVLRAILLNLLVWIPLVTLTFVLLGVIGGFLAGAGAGLRWCNPYTVEIVADALSRRSFAAAEGVQAATGQVTDMLNAQVAVYCIAFAAGLAILAAFVLTSVCYALHAGTRHDGRLDRAPATGGGWAHWAGFVAAAIAILAIAWALWSFPRHWLMTLALCGILLVVGCLASWLLLQATRVPGLALRYGGRRLFEKMFGFALVVALGLLIVGTLPWIHALLRSYVATAGSAAIALSAATALWGHWKSLRGGESGGRALAIVMPVGSALFLYGIALVAYDLAFLLATTWNVDAMVDGDIGGKSLMLAAFIVSVLVALVTGYRSNLNYISPHRFYRDRLMEAFMPDWRTVNSQLARQGLIGAVGAARSADGLFLADTWSPSSPGPYPILNTNVILVNSASRKWRVWGGDSFVLTPLVCGSDATGWRRTARFMNGEMSLPSAMAVSGAAASPNAGIGGIGGTRDRLVSILMTLLDFRLGYWVPNPGRSSRWFGRPNHFMPGFVYAMTRYGFAEDSKYLELSDGGHFENLGLYELVRRRAKLIFICDGSADKETSYAGFVTVLRRMKETFGATVELKPGLGPEVLVPMKTTAAAYPSKALFARRGYFVARLRYDDGSAGMIVYMKTALLGNLSMEALGYAGANPDFPDQTTADQFFDEEQFEAYRELGYRIATAMIEDVDPAAVIARMDAGEAVDAIVDAIWDRQKQLLPPAP